VTARPTERALPPLVLPVHLGEVTDEERVLAVRLALVLIDRRDRADHELVARPGVHDHRLARRVILHDHRRPPARRLRRRADDRKDHRAIARRGRGWGRRRQVDVERRRRVEPTDERRRRRRELDDAHRDGGGAPASVAGAAKPVPLKDA